MNSSGIPDLLSNNRLSRQISGVTNELSRAAEEVTSGLYADKIAASGYNPARLTAIERDLTLIASAERSLTIAQNRASVTQSALQILRGTVEGLGVDLGSLVETNDIIAATRLSDGARDSFDAAVSALNARYGGRALFSGAAVDQSAVKPSTEILADVQAAVATATGAAEAIAAVDAYFADGGGFDTDGYTGSVSDASAVELNAGSRLNYAIRADADEVKSVLRSLALVVVGNEGGFAGDSDEARLAVFREGAQSALIATEEIVNLEARLGIAEGRIDAAIVRTGSERLFLEQARNGIIARDQYDASAEYTAIETQLKIIFSITSRFSQLNLTNYL